MHEEDKRQFQVLRMRQISCCRTACDLLSEWPTLSPPSAKAGNQRSREAQIRKVRSAVCDGYSAV